MGLVVYESISIKISHFTRQEMLYALPRTEFAIYLLTRSQRNIDKVTIGERELEGLRCVKYTINDCHDKIISEISMERYKTKWEQLAGLEKREKFDALPSTEFAIYLLTRSQRNIDKVTIGYSDACLVSSTRSTIATAQ
jgi:hypothetical protein